MKVLKRSPWWRRVVRRLGRESFRLAENNDDPRIEHNGERWLVRELVLAHGRGGVARPMVVMDAGANIGDYSRLVLQTAQAAGCPVELHLFEPSPHCVAILRAGFATAANVRIVAAALSDREGEAVLHDGKTGSSWASLMVRPGGTGGTAESVAVALMRLADYLDQHRVAHLDLLKLDVEGAELAVLRGAGERLRPEMVDAIQFEYGGTTMDAGTTLRDLYGLLEARGYVLTKLFPSALEVRGYSPWMEHYAYANYVALSPRWCGARTRR